MFLGTQGQPSLRPASSGCVSPSLYFQLLSFLATQCRCLSRTFTCSAGPACYRQASARHLPSPCPLCPFALLVKSFFSKSLIHNSKLLPGLEFAKLVLQGLAKRTTNECFALNPPDQQYRPRITTCRKGSPRIGCPLFPTLRKTRFNEMRLTGSQLCRAGVRRHQHIAARKQTAPCATAGQMDTFCGPGGRKSDWT